MIRCTITYTDGCTSSVESFTTPDFAFAFARIVRGQHPTATVELTQHCCECERDHDAEDMPPECEDCGVCLGTEEGPHCRACVELRTECLCPGGEELGPCSCPACTGRIGGPR